MFNYQLLLCDDDELCHLTLHRLLQDNYRLSCVSNAEELWSCLEQATPDVVLLDLTLRVAEDGFAVLQKIRQRWPSLPVVIYSGIANYGAVVKAIRLGALDFIPKGISAHELRQQLEEVIHSTRKAKHSHIRPELVGEHVAIKHIRHLIDCATSLDQANMLVVGEPGTGKHVVVDTFKQALAEKKGQGHIIELDCVALSWQEPTCLFPLLQERVNTSSPLANEQRIFVFLKEVNSLTPAMQGRLLRWIDACRSSIEQSGPNPGNSCHFVSTSHVDIELLVRENKFRLDLFMMLNMFVVNMPTLRERIDDLMLLIDYLCYLGNLPKTFRFSTSSLQLLRKYDWPGNIRELANVLHYCASVANGEEIQLHHLPSKISTVVAHGHDLDPARTFGDKLQQFQRIELQREYTLHNGNISKMARSLKSDRSSLYNKLKKLGIHHASSSK